MLAEVNYAELAEKAMRAIRDAVPNASVSTTEGWHGRVHMKIVAPYFDGKSESDKQTIVWDVLRDSLGEEAQGIALALVYGHDEF